MRTTVNPRLTDDLLEELVDLWLAVTEAGGAVGFVAPISRERLAREVAGFWDRVIDGISDLVLVSDASGAVLGMGFLTPSADRDVAPHRGEVQKVMRHPDAGGRGVGVEVLAGLEAQARVRGMRLLTLTVRGGTGREGFYIDHGYHLLAELPGWLLINEEPTLSLVLAKDLDETEDDVAMTTGEGGAGSSSGGEERALAGRAGAASGGGVGAASAAGVGVGPIQLAVRRLDPDLPLPRYAKPGDAGLDLLARHRLVLPPGMRAVMPTGIAIAIPIGWVGLIHPRSGLAVGSGLSIVNSPGTIDAGYRGELKVPLINLDPSATIRLERGDRIAQLILQQVAHADLVEVDELPDGVRGDAGFGSTGR